MPIEFIVTTALLALFFIWFGIFALCRTAAGSDRDMRGPRR